MYMYKVSSAICFAFLAQGIGCIVLTPPVWIQGQPASITCNDSFVVYITRDVLVTACPIEPTVQCSITRDQPNKPVYNYINYYTVSRSGNDVSINIANVSKDRDSGFWACSGSTADSKQNITIDVKVIKPVPSVNIRVTNLIVNQTTDIICKTGVSYPHATITWSIGGNNLGSGTTSNNSDGTTTSILQYTADKSDHNKILQCTATNGYGKRKTESITLNIRYPPLLHIEPTGDYSIIQGKQLVLTCDVDDSNPPVPGNGYAWSKDGVQITGQSSSTYILSSQRSHTGSYTCTGSNTIGPGKTSTPVQVDVLYPPIVSTPSTYQVIESTDLTLQCTATANPGNINYRWTGPGDLNYTGSSLTISNIGKDKYGVYTCTATNTMVPTALPQQTGSGSNATTVNVLYGPTVTISSDDITKILENTDHILTCTVQSNPTATNYTWYLPNGTSIPGDRELVISKRNQGGIYRCEANTTLVPTVGSPITRSNSTTIDITVLYQDKIAMDINKPVVEKGEEITISCSADSNPISWIKWYRGNDLLQTKQTTEDVYIVHKATCFDTGVYTCHYRNGETTKSTSETVFVKCSQVAETRKNLNTRIVKNLGQKAELFADVIVYPPPTYIWYFVDSGDLIPISNNGTYKQTDIGPQTSLVITLTSAKLYGQYLLTISNDVGDTTLSFNLTPTTRPDSPDNLQVTSSSSQTICFTWNPGFNGGLDQTFAVELKMASSEKWMKVTQDITNQEYCLQQLTPGTSYNIRVEGRNSLGQSSGSAVLLAVTTERGNTSAANGDPGVGIGIGIGIGISIVLALMVLAVLYVYSRISQGKQKQPESATYTDLDNRNVSDDVQTYQELNMVNISEPVQTSNTEQYVNVPRNLLPQTDNV